VPEGGATEATVPATLKRYGYDATSVPLDKAA
jgi:hypothetical protein